MFKQREFFNITLRTTPDYEIDFRKFQQRNLKTNKSRRIRIQSVAPPGAVGAQANGARTTGKEIRFQWQERPGKWIDFDWAADNMLWTDLCGPDKHVIDRSS